MRSHHKGHYSIVNGSDKEPGGVRRGRTRKPPKQQVSLWERAKKKAADIAKDIAKDAIEEAAKALKKRHDDAEKERARGTVKEGGTKSHHKGRYAIANGSDKEPGGVRRGPRLSVSKNEKQNQKRTSWRLSKSRARGK